MPTAPPARVTSMTVLRTVAGRSCCASAPWPWASKPTASTAQSTSGSPRSCSSWSLVSPCETSIVSQPKLRAWASRSFCRSATATTAAPSRYADVAAARPTGPAPATYTVDPGRTPAVMAPWKPVGKMSDSMARSRIFSMAWSRSGNFRRFQSAYGTSAYSACPPTQPPMSTYPYADPGRSGLTFRQTPVLPSLQLRHRPQAMLNGTDTMSPTLMNSTSGPVSTTSPVISCPSGSPWGAVVRPRTMCWSLPQMLVATTLRIAACGSLRPTLAGFTPGPSLSSNVGYSVVSTATLPGPLKMTALLPGMDSAPS